MQMMPLFGYFPESGNQREVGNVLRMQTFDEEKFSRKEVLDADRLHLSLLHENCVRDPSASLPWTFGSPGHQLPNATASNPEVLMHQDDPDILAKLRQCPDVDIFLPVGIHGNGYCEDAVAYVKCESFFSLER